MDSSSSSSRAKYTGTMVSVANSSGSSSMNCYSGRRETKIRWEHPTRVSQRIAALPALCPEASWTCSGAVWWPRLPQTVGGLSGISRKRNRRAASSRIACWAPRPPPYEPPCLKWHYGNLRIILIVNTCVAFTMKKFSYDHVFFFLFTKIYQINIWEIHKHLWNQFWFMTSAIWLQWRIFI